MKPFSFEVGRKQRSLALALSLSIFSSLPAISAELVNVDNFVRAETTMQFSRVLPLAGGEVNRWAHIRQPTPIDQQNVIRMNRDTLYSGAVVDIREGAIITVPDGGDRYLSIMVVTEDHHVNKIFHQPGQHELNRDEFDTDYVFVSARILVDASDATDIAVVNQLQDQLAVSAGSAVPYPKPDYDMESYQSTHGALLELSRALPDARYMFGSKEETTEVRHLIGTAFGWGGLPEHEAYYVNVEPDLPVGHYQLTVEDVPVKAFWSVTVYNRDGFLEPNDSNTYSINSVSGIKNSDGSVTINFGGSAGSINNIPIAEGWNYLIRFYQPDSSIVDRAWVFPQARAVK